MQTRLGARVLLIVLTALRQQARNLKSGGFFSDPTEEFATPLFFSNTVGEMRGFQRCS